VSRIDDHVEELAPLRGLPWRRMPAPPALERVAQLNQQPASEPIPVEVG
jgi:hypothetical protein